MCLGERAAVPAEKGGHRRHVIAPGDHGHAEPPTVAVKVARDQTGDAAFCSGVN